MHNSSTEYGDDGSSTSISSTKAGTSGCAFRHLDIDRDVTVNNYQDDEVRPAKADVIAALIKMNEGCGEWSLANTCEHIATSIRYGEARAKCKQVCAGNKKIFILNNAKTIITFYIVKNVVVILLCPISFLDGFIGSSDMPIRQFLLRSEEIPKRQQIPARSGRSSLRIYIAVFI